MKGVSYISDGNNKKYAVQIDLKLLEMQEDKLEDFIDGIIAASRVNEERKPLDFVIKQLKERSL
jgi:hypothetical protein